MDDKTALKKLQKQYEKLLRESKFDRAAIVVEEIVAKQEKALGPDHPDVAGSLNDLGFIYNTLGDYQKAEPLYKRSLEIYEKVLGPDHRDVALSLFDLGNVFF
ncbi:MAG: tetratricopeptide repeat-containing protein, partial [Deltaproteobacteria bacterium]